MLKNDTLDDGFKNNIVNLFPIKLHKNSPSFKYLSKITKDY